MRAAGTRWSDEAGEVIAAVDADLNALDPTDYAVGDEPDVADELAARMAASEQRLAEMEAQPQDYSVELPEPWEDRAVDAMSRQREYIQNALGRPTTMGEDARLADYALRDAEVSGELPDLLQAASRLGGEGRPPLHDLDTHDGRTDYATERLRELGGEVDEWGQQARRAEEYDTSTHQGRVDAAVDALHGHDTAGMTYDGGDYEQ